MGKLWDWFIGEWSELWPGVEDIPVEEHKRVKGELEELQNVLERGFNRKCDRSQNCKLEIYQDKSGEFRWCLKAGNNKIIAESGEGYKTKQALEKSLLLVRDIMDIVAIKERK